MEKARMQIKKIIKLITLLIRSDILLTSFLYLPFLQNFLFAKQKGKLIERDKAIITVFKQKKNL